MTWHAANGGNDSLHGLRVLVVEDEPLIALELQALLSEHGAEVVGPGSDLAEGGRLARQEDLSVALLDVRLGSQSVAPIAEILHARGVPFAFYTGQLESDAVRRDWPDAPVIGKPSPSRQLIEAIGRLQSTGPVRE